MTDSGHATAPAVALLFEDTELGSHLKQALLALGARIVHEGPAASVQRQDLESSGAEVVVVNLDAAVEDQLDALYDALDETRQRVVFNDAEVSRGLSGWDQARWARHLAAKVVGHVDVDPPRPPDARQVDVVATLAADVPATAAAVAGNEWPADDFALIQAGIDSNPDGNAGQPDTRSAEMDALGAELEALLAEVDGEAGDIAPEAPAADSDSYVVTGDAWADPDPAAEADGLDDAVSTGDGSDSHSSEDAGSEHAVAGPALAAETVEPAPTPDGAADGDGGDDLLAELAIEDRQTVPAPAPALDWSLEDMDDAPAPAPPAAEGTPADFGIEKLSASDYLAPEGEKVHPSFTPSLNLELVAIEEAIAPAAHGDAGYEMMLDDSAGVRRLVVLAASAGAGDAVAHFLGALPRTLPAALLLVQHHSGDTRTLIDELAAVAPLPVRLAEDGGRLHHGQLLVAPCGAQVSVARSGRVSVVGAEPLSTGDPSIDTTLAAAAAVFGADALAVLFAGDSHDALAGAQAVFDGGGRVWGEAPAGTDTDSMVAIACAENLVDHLDTPERLGTRLAVEFAA